MIKGIIGKKIGMTQIFADGGAATPVTVIQAGPCWVTQVKATEKDGYSAVQLGFEAIGADIEECRFCDQDTGPEIQKRVEPISRSGA